MSDNGAPPIQNLRLGSIKGCRQTFARLLRLRARGEIESSDFRDLVYGLSHMIAYWSLEKDLEFDARLETIEHELAELQKRPA